MKRIKSNDYAWKMILCMYKSHSVQVLCFPRLIYLTSSTMNIKRCWFVYFNFLVCLSIKYIGQEFSWFFSLLNFVSIQKYLCNICLSVATYEHDTCIIVIKFISTRVISLQSNKTIMFRYFLSYIIFYCFIYSLLIITKKVTSIT